MDKNLKELPILIWLIPCSMLVIGLLPLPYGYYTLLRIVVCGAGIYLGFCSWDGPKLHRNFAIALFLMAVLFNPLIPIYLERGIWAFLDIGAAILIGTHLFQTRR